MKSLPLLLAALLLLASAAFAADSTAILTLPGLDARFIRQMTEAQVQAAFPGVSFKSQEFPGTPLTSLETNVNAGDYSYALALDFSDHKLRALHLSVFDTEATSAWFDSLVTALPAETEHHDLNADEGDTLEEWQTPQIEYRRDIMRDYDQDVTLVDYTITFK